MWGFDIEICNCKECMRLCIGSCPPESRSCSEAPKHAIHVFAPRSIRSPAEIQVCLVVLRVQEKDEQNGARLEGNCIACAR